MIKKFFISMLGSMAGFILSIMIMGFVLFLSFASLLASLSVQKPDKGKVLCINLEGNIDERQPVVDVANFLSYDSFESLCDITNAIRLAADDKDIEGIYILCKGSQMGIASRSEIISALQRFKESGKWVIAYGDNYSQGDYYVASAADEVYVNPVGSITISGLSVTTVFFKDLLEKVGVDMQVVKVGDFKSAVEPFIRTDMSEPSIHQTQVFLDNMWGDITKSIAQNRGLTATKINEIADSLPFTWESELYRKHRLVTALMYQTEVEDIIAEKIGYDRTCDELPLISPSEYMTLKQGKLGKESKHHIAVLYAHGDINEQGVNCIASQDMVPLIEKLAYDKNVDALVMRVNSGGGSAYASEQIWHAIEIFKKTNKPVYVSMGDYAASGGYYISCGADKIFADATTLTGSIGIFGLIPNAENLLTDKIGIDFQTVETNEGANFPMIYKPMDDRQYASMQRYVEHGYDIFVSRVAQGRNLPVDSVKAIGGGRVWDGTSALKLGLVDQIGTLHDAIREIAIEVDLNANDFVIYPIMEPDPFALLLSSSQTTVNIGLLPVDADAIAPYVEFARNCHNFHPVQARMEPIIFN